MIKALKSLFNIGLILFFILIFTTEARAETATPKIIKLTAQNVVLLTGTAQANSEILVYLDGNYVGLAEAETRTKAELIWQFQSNSASKLADGAHSVMVVAQDKTSLVLSAPTTEIKFAVNAVPAPTLVAPNEKTATANLKPLITGLTKDNTLVKIYIDNVYDGETGILKHDSGTANFAYQPSFDLSRGKHEIRALAQGSSGQTSIMSLALNFIIELPFPAPTMLKPVINRDTSVNRPFIVGLAKNDSKIKIYIDQKYNGEFTIKNHQSGTANFAYKPVKGLTRGEHSVYTVAIDKRGKASVSSQAVNFTIKSTAIAQSVQEERKEVVAEIKEPVSAKSEPAVISGSSGTVEEKPEAKPATPDKTQAEQGAKSTGDSVAERQLAIKQNLEEKEKAALEKVKNLIGPNVEETKNSRGMINEEKQNSGRLKLSLIIFILFLVGVVAWLLWVNRELVKERRAQNEAEEKAKENKDNPLGGGQDNKLL